MTTDNLRTDDRLLIRQDLRLVQNVALRTDTLVIGRSPSCDIRLDHPDVSTVHARLHRAGDGWHITDNDSARGMRVNGRKTGEAILVPGDVVDIRPFSMNFLGGETAGDSRTLDRSITLTGAGLRTTLVRDTRDPGVVIQKRLEVLYARARLILARK
jgi:pSer/pThr/pTyr-binding forkhead associated (FHA) protein